MDVDNACGGRGYSLPLEQVLVALVQLARDCVAQTHQLINCDDNLNSGAPSLLLSIGLLPLLSSLLLLLLPVTLRRKTRSHTLRCCTGRTTRDARDCRCTRKVILDTRCDGVHSP